MARLIDNKNIRQMFFSKLAMESWISSWQTKTIIQGQYKAYTIVKRIYSTPKHNIAIACASGFARDRVVAN